MWVCLCGYARALLLGAAKRDRNVQLASLHSCVLVPPAIPIFDPIRQVGRRDTTPTLVVLLVVTLCVLQVDRR